MSGTTVRYDNYPLQNNLKTYKETDVRQLLRMWESEISTEIPDPSKMGIRPR